jgi:hypothetical protein
VLPERRMWPAALIAGAFFAIFAGVLAIQIAKFDAHGGRSVFDLSFMLFELFWIVGWSFGVIILGLITLLLALHGESARLAHGRLILVPRLGPLKFVTEYDLARMRNLRIEHAGSAETVRIRFDYGSGDCGLGDSMPRADAEGLIEQIRAATPVNISAAAEAPSVPIETALPPAPAPAALPAPKPLPLTSASALALIAANLIPLAGVVAGRWGLGEVMVLFWSESAIIGFYTLLRMAVVGKWAALFAGPYFVVHFGAFMVAHFAFVYTFFVRGFAQSGPEPGAREALTALYGPLWPALAALFASHAVSFAFNFLGQREYAHTTLEALTTAPYKRIFLMHITIIFGGGIAIAFGTPTPVLALLILLKIWTDLRAHTREHGAA